LAHTIRDKRKLLNRVRRLQGQLAAVEKALLEERDCEDVPSVRRLSRGAIGALTAEVMEGHVRRDGARALATTTPEGR